MGNGWHEWPLMVFTVFGQCVVGGFMVIAWTLMADNKEHINTRRLLWMSIILWILMGIGFIASILHLGSPLRAFNSLNRIGSSALSNEIASGSLFFAVGGFWWLISLTGKLPRVLSRVWMVATMFVGIAFVWMMCRVYLINTVPTWFSLWTPLNFFLTLFIGGPLLGAFILRAADVKTTSMRILPAITLLAVIISAVVVLLQGMGLSTIQSAIQQASTLVPLYGVLMSWRLGLLILALLCWIWPHFKGREATMPGLALAFLLVIAGELIGRGVFYGLHMTVGMAVAS